ncbi:MAG: hypothetical protein FWD76_02760 [Firmicutes bacterium]|nr:hypothetical protein [Bacillota bacterium]
MKKILIIVIGCIMLSLSIFAIVGCNKSDYQLQSAKLSVQRIASNKYAATISGRLLVNRKQVSAITLTYTLLDENENELGDISASADSVDFTKNTWKGWEFTMVGTFTVRPTTLSAPTIVTINK